MPEKPTPEEFNKPFEVKETQEQNPEILAKVMDKVIDISANGTAFTVLNGMPNSDEIKSEEDRQARYKKTDNDFANLLRVGLLSPHIREELDAQSNRPKSRQGKIPISQGMRDYIRKAAPGLSGTSQQNVYISILSSSKGFIPRDRIEKGYFEDEEIKNPKIRTNTYWEKSRIAPIAVAIDFKDYKAFDLSTMTQKKSHTLPTDQERQLPDAPGAGGTHDVKVLNRIGPRHFLGVIMGKAELSDSEFENRLERLLSAMKEVDAKKPDRLLPFYDEYGNLLWPKKMTYKQLQEFVAQRGKTNVEGK